MNKLYFTEHRNYIGPRNARRRQNGLRILNELWLDQIRWSISQQHTHKKSHHKKTQYIWTRIGWFMKKSTFCSSKRHLFHQTMKYSANQKGSYCPIQARPAIIIRKTLRQVWFLSTLPVVSNTRLANNTTKYLSQQFRCENSFDTF